jgi:hypothetical protein
MERPLYTSCAPAKSLPSSWKSWLSTRFWLSWGRKSAAFVHEFHPDWIERLNLHNQLQRHHVDRILRRLVHPYHDTARLEKNRTKMLQFFGRLEIGQRDYMGKQIVYCKPFRDIDLDKENAAGRMDCVFFIPPPPYYTGRRRDFDLSLENAWYGRVSLLCNMKYRTDSGEVRDVDCTMMERAADGRVGVQYPGEKEITFPPFTCLESDGDPRVERTGQGEIVISPLEVAAARRLLQLCGGQVLSL